VSLSYAEDGRRRSKTYYCSSWSEAEAKLTEAASRSKSALNLDIRNQTVGEF
jgi:hypothetical protein